MANESPGFVSYEVDNDNLFKQAIERAKRVTDDLTIPLKQISADFYKSEQAIFQLQGPGQYPDLNDAYKKAKGKKVGFVYPILKRSGRLAKSLLKPNEADSVWDIINKDTLIIGTSVPYAIFHQSDEPRSKIPLRKFLFIGPEAPRFAIGPLQGRAERWLNILNTFVLAKLGITGAAAGAAPKP